MNGKLTVSGIRELCDDFTDLAVSVYHVSDRRFIYCSPSIQTLLGYRPEHLVEGGLEFWYGIVEPRERPIIQEKLTGFVFNSGSGPSAEARKPIRYRVQNADGKWVCLRHKIHLRRIDDALMALNVICDRSERHLLDDYLGLTIPNGCNGTGSRPAGNISEREIQVLKMIACGMPSRQIAAKLYISKHTVISHRKNLIEKFGVKNTAELIYEASKVIAL